MLTRHEKHGILYLQQYNSLNYISKYPSRFISMKKSQEYLKINKILYKKYRNLYTFIFMQDEGVEKIYFCGIYGIFSIFWHEKIFFWCKNREKKYRKIQRIMLLGQKKIFLFIFCCPVDHQECCRTPDDLEPDNQCIRKAKDMSRFDFW